MRNLGSYPKPKALERAGYDFPRYLERNGHMMRDDGERRRAGQMIATAFAGSLVSVVALLNWM